MVTKKLPSVSILIPTLNSAKVLKSCLESISSQDYPIKKMEIIIADGGSTDKTLKIAKNHGAKVYKNRLKTGEAGKLVALLHAKGELVALIDSDNLLPDREWLKKMVIPFLEDREIVGSEPWKYSYRKSDGFIDRYCSLIGMNDPICHFLGNYDRLNLLTGKWTGLLVKEEDKGDWIKVFLGSGLVPTIGANGTIFKRKILTKYCLTKNYFFDIDILSKIIKERPIAFAKVKRGIVHLFCGSDIKKFIRKQKRRINDLFYYQKEGLRAYPWQRKYRWGIIKFSISCILIFPLLAQSVKGYLKKPDSAWFFHPIACWITFIVYSWGVVFGSLFPRAEDRKGWKQ